MKNLNFDSLPTKDDLYPTNEPGIYNLRIIKAEKNYAKSTGSLMLQCDYETVGLKPNFQLRYDNYVIATADGTPVNFGQVKLKALLEAINVIPQGDFDIQILPPLIKGKVFSAKLDYDKSDSRYLRVVGTEIYKTTLTEAVTEEKITAISTAPVSPAVGISDIEITDDDDNF